MALSRSAPFVASAIALVVSMSPVARATCLVATPRASIVTPLTEPVPKNATLLVRVELGASTEGMRVTERSDGTYALPDLALVQGETRIPIDVAVLRAGLMRLSFASEPREGEYELVGANERGIAIRIGGTLPPAPLPPLVSSAVHQERMAFRGDAPSASWTTRVTLAHALPSTIALAAVRAADRPGTWQLFEAGNGQSALEASGGDRCGTRVVLGRGRLWNDMNAELVTIDRYGRVSPPSAPFRVR